MFAITGITGKVGGEVAQRLLNANRRVRAVVRDPGKGAAWTSRGCGTALAHMEDAAALAAAFRGAEGVFVLAPGNFDPSPGFPEARAIAVALRSAREALFESQGMKNPAPRIQMLDGFNEGWIDFEGGQAGSRKGRVDLETVLTALVGRE